MDAIDRAKGCLIGLALGDALGAPFESKRAKDIPNPVAAFELPWNDFPPGSTTDATAMAVNLAWSLAERGAFDPQDVVRRHLEWFQTNPPGVGNQVRRVLRRVGEGVPAEDAARSLWEERGPEASAGNGSVMYCAPLGVAYAGEPDRLLQSAPRLSDLTHHDERCKTAVVAVTQAVAALVRGEPRRGALVAAMAAAADREGAEELEFLVGVAGRGRPVDGPDQGFCLFAAAVALQALSRHRDFDPGIRWVVSLGGDTSTNAAVTGALVGAAVGRSGLPTYWLDVLAGRAALEELAERLGDASVASMRRGGGTHPSWPSPSGGSRA